MDHEAGIGPLSVHTPGDNEARGADCGGSCTHGRTDPGALADLQSSPYLAFALELASKHEGPSRPAWQQLPERERGDYEAAGFRMSDPVPPLPSTERKEI